MADVLLTQRLRLRRWLARDEAPMAAINRDPEVARYLNRPSDEAAVAAFFGEVAAHWDTYGYGFYAVDLLGVEERFVGFAGFSHPTFIPAVADRPELGWRLARSAWGAGLATEAATAVLRDGFDRLGLSELIAVIHPENARSRRVATKLGMREECQLHNPVLGREVDIWQTTPGAGRAAGQPGRGSGRHPADQPVANMR
jgi:RimJ/RimL family protein N-acetyltransferase